MKKVKTKLLKCYKNRLVLQKSPETKQSSEPFSAWRTGGTEMQLRTEVSFFDLWKTVKETY